MAASDEKESRLVRFLDVFGNIFALNIVYVLFSLPVITIGASTTALYSVALKLVKKEEGPIFKSFWNAFKSNFKRGTQAWLIVLAALIVLYTEFLMVCTVEGTIASVYTVIMIVEAVVLAFILPFLFPLISRFENTLWNTIKNSFLLSVSNLGSWLKIGLAWFAPIFLTLYYPKIFLLTWYFWLFLVFGLIAYGTSHTILKVFKRIEVAQLAKEEQEKEEQKKRERASIAKKVKQLAPDTEAQQENE